MEEEGRGPRPQDSVEQNKLFKFPHCPHCGSTDRMVGRQLQKARAMGLAGEDWDACFQAIQGVVIEPGKMKRVIIGQLLPAYIVRTDVCLKCGTLYAIDVELTTARQELKPVLPAGLHLGPGNGGG